MDFSKLSTSKKLILLGGALAVFSQFFHWAGWGGYEFSGFKFRGYFVLIAFIYPVYMVWQGRTLKKKTALISLACGFVIMFFVNGMFNLEIRAPGVYSMVGKKMMIAAIIMSMVGVLMEKEQNIVPIKNN